MKSLKITLLAIFSIALLTGVSQLNGDPTPTTEKEELRKGQTTVSVLKHKKKREVPANG